MYNLKYSYNMPSNRTTISKDINPKWNGFPYVISYLRVIGCIRIESFHTFAYYSGSYILWWFYCSLTRNVLMNGFLCCCCNVLSLSIPNTCTWNTDWTHYMNTKYQPFLWWHVMFCPCLTWSAINFWGALMR